MLPREEIASRLYGTTRSEGNVGSGGTAVIYGTAVADSENGSVKVIPYGAQVTAPDGEDGTLTVPTSPAVQEGDSVMLIGAGGGRQPLSVVSVVGSGDRTAAIAADAKAAVDEAVEEVAEVKQDIADFKSGADVDYAIYSYVDDEIGEFSQTVSATYLSKSDAQTTYATQSQLTQTAEGITASVSQDYVSKADAQTTYATKSELTVGLDGITAEVSQNYATKTEAATTGSGSGESVEVADGAVLRSLTVYGKSVQDGTPTPDAPVEIQTVSGANLLPKMTAGTYGTNGITIEVDSNGVATLSGTTTANGNAAIIPLEQPITITQQMVDDGFYVHYNNSESNANAAPNFESSTAVSAFSYTMAPANRIVRLSSSHVGKTIDRVRFWLSRGVTLSGTLAPALMTYSSAVPYVPYGSMGLKVTKDGTTTVTPIQLNGNVLASLPDGTKDVLTVDETGHCVITKNTNHIASYNGESVGSVYIATTGTLETGAEVYYKRSSGTTVDLGYITMPELADGCTVEILASLTPTFDASWYTGNGSAIYEQSTRITQTEQDVTTAITGIEGLQTMVRQYGSGVLVCRTGNSVGALVNADGSFDVVSVSWSGDVPTAGTVLGRYAASGIYLGNPSDTTKPYMALDADSLDLFWSNMPILHLGINETTQTPYILSGYNPSFSASDFGGASATFGEYCRASATDSFAAGHLCQVNSGANYSAAIGNNLRVIAANQVVVGCYNDSTVLGDARFVVGNGYNGSPSNAFAVWDDGSIKYKAPSTRFGETSGADIAITRTYTANGFAIENAVFHATADMCVMPVQFTATSNVALSAQKVATIPAAYAPAESARCAIWCSPSWSGSDFTCGYVDVNPSGEVSVTAPSAKYWFGQVVWIRA